MVRSLFLEQRDTAAPTEDDVRFVQNCVRQYWHWRSEFPHVVLAREPQLFNLKLGYAGSADALVWVLPGVSPDVAWWQKRADTGRVTRETIDNFGGSVLLVDYTTSKGLWTEHIIQAHAYLAAEFVGADGIVDERLTDLLTIARRGALVQVRPDAVHMLTFSMRSDVLAAFVGMVRLAHLVAENPEPRLLADESLVWRAEDTEESEYLEGEDV